MPILIPGTNDAHTFATLTDAINRRPYIPNGVSALGWNAEGLRGRVAMIDQRDDGVDLIDEKPWDSPGSQVVVNDADPLLIHVPHYPHNFTLRPEEVRSRRAFGSETAYEMPQERQDRILSRWKDDVDYTQEILRVGAVFGKIRRRDGSVRKDLTEVFGARPFVFAFPFADANKNFYKFLTAVKQFVGDRIGALRISGWAAFAATEMHGKVVYHKSVNDSYKFWDSAAVLRADATKAPFTMASDVELEHYRNSTIPRSNGRQVFPRDAIAMIAKADGLLQTRYAPRSDMRDVNELGLPMYLSPEDLPHGRGVEVEGETNVINFVKRPEAVIIIVDAADADAIAFYAPNGLDTVEF